MVKYYVRLVHGEVYVRFVHGEVLCKACPW